MNTEESKSNVLPLDRWKSFRRKIPYGVVKTGFMVNEADRCELIPDPEKIYWLEQAFDYITNGTSLREAADWVSQKIHMSVHHQTLSNLYATYRKPYHKGRSYKRTRAPTSAATKKLISAKLQARSATKKAIELEKKQAQKKKQLQPEQWDSPREKVEHPDYSVDVNDPNKTRVKILFQPNPGPQYEFLTATEEEVLYGGAAGGEDKSSYRLLSW